ncbi:MAG: RtcB family protein [Armatimonadota bacterium]|nr:RtcB family protein [Armatimonadota bacterium]
MADQAWKGPLEKVDECRWRIPKSYKREMKVDAILYATEKMLDHIKRDMALEQLANVATLPGIVRCAIAMPDIHWGYGFPIGGVAAMDTEAGVISPGGVGYDINCGVRLLCTNLTYDDVEPKLEQLVDTLYHMVPAGVGAEGAVVVKSKDEFEKVLVEGARWAVYRRNFGVPEDLECMEEYGCIDGADPTKVSKRAIERGMPQLGTLGSGNHFLEVQIVQEIYNPKIAQAMGIEKVGQIVVMIHCGSRGFGHQVCDDYLDVMELAIRKYGIWLPDRQLACAPFQSPEAQNYLGAMRCAINYAFANRQCITHNVRKAFERVFGTTWEKLGIRVIYDVAHNIAKVEEHEINGEKKKVVVHRKGATRAFPPGHSAIPERYRQIGQPVLIPGSMGTGSFLLVGTEGAMKETFGSTCHGAGRVMSRAAAKRSTDVNELLQRLRKQGIIVRGTTKATVVEETPEAYKDVDEVTKCVHEAGISIRVARMRPIGVVKG